MSIFNPIKKENPLTFNQKMIRLCIWWVLIFGTIIIVLPKLRTQVINLQSPEVLLQPSCNLSKLDEGDVVMYRGQKRAIMEVYDWGTYPDDYRIDFKFSK